LIFEVLSKTLVVELDKGTVIFTKKISRKIMLVAYVQIQVIFSTFARRKMPDKTFIFITKLYFLYEAT